MNTLIPSYEEFVALEMKTLRWLQTETGKRRATAHVADDIGRTMDASESELYAFDTYFDCRYERRKGRIFVGGEVVAKVDDCITSLSYYIAVADIGCRPINVLRKYHFDYTCDGLCEEQGERRHNHPYFHVQYGGKLPEGMKRQAVNEEDLLGLRPDISEPRIFFTPMSITLLFELAFNEFPTTESESIRGDGFWKCLVRLNQKKLLAKYYAKCLEIVNNQDLLCDRVYIR